MVQRFGQRKLLCQCLDEVCRWNAVWSGNGSRNQHREDACKRTCWIGRIGDLQIHDEEQGPWWKLYRRFRKGRSRLLPQGYSKKSPRLPIVNWHANASTWHIDHYKVSTGRLAFNSPFECSSSVQHCFGEPTLFSGFFDLFPIVMTDHHSSCSPCLSLLTTTRSMILLVGSIERNGETHFRLISSCTLPTAAPPSNLRLRIAPSSPSRETLALNTNSL